jgi:hypothetical protein
MDGFRVESCPDAFPGDLLGREAVPGDELRPAGRWELVWEGTSHDDGVEQFIGAMEALRRRGCGWVRMLDPQGFVTLLEGCDPEERAMTEEG